jgi:CCR4-NOT transcription complex subunit 1
MAIRYRYAQTDHDVVPPEVLAALYLLNILFEHNPLAMQLKRNGSAVTVDEEACSKFLRNLGAIRLDEEQVGAALLYTAISRTPRFSASVFVNGVRKEVSNTFSWQQVVAQFDQEKLRVSNEQFLALYHALRPLAESEHDTSFDIQRLWGGLWVNPETQLSFICAYASLSPEQLDATTIPGLSMSFTLDDYVGAGQIIQDRATQAIKHPLVSVVALSAIFHVALHSATASETAEAKRLFQEVVVPNLDVFVVSAFGIPKPWPELALDTLSSLFERFLFKIEKNYDFVLYSLWRKDKTWVVKHLIETHGKAPLELPILLEHALRHEWLDQLLSFLNGFGVDLAALAHARGFLDLERWHHMHARNPELPQTLVRFLQIKAEHELEFQRGEGPRSVTLPVKTISALLNILTDIVPQNQQDDSMIVQRGCITAYPRLINYGEGFDEIIDENGKNGNSLPKEANDTMETHYKQMYSEEIKVVAVVEALRRYKFSTNPADQDVFACMIHGLFDEYSLYSTYPLEALKTTALLFGGIIRHKLLPLLPLEIGLGMILDAVKNNGGDQPMYKFGLEALRQTFDLFGEWPGFCRHLVQIPGLRGTDAWLKAEEVIRSQEEKSVNSHGNGVTNHNDGVNGEAVLNGNFDEMLAAESTAPPFSSINADAPVYSDIYEEPSGDTQEKVLFVLNNITDRNLETKFKELKDVIDLKHQQWFAGHLVEQRAKMQPNYHQLYLDLVKLFEDKSLWSEVLRETYVSVIRMLNAETTMQSSSERTHLKNLGGWLGSLTLARDKPIKHRNIAFKQLLMEAFDTQRLIVVIPFVCKVLLQGANSTVFKPPNPWLMDIIHLLIELYQHAELKLNLKFEIEVLCKGLNLDHKSIEPSTDIQTRLPPMDEPTEPTALEVGDRFDSMSLNGMGGGVGSGRFSPEEITSSIPDLGPLLVYPPSNDVASEARLQEIVKIAITRAVHEIISPVVERSVTIAAISTAQMIHKDFATEPDENRVRSAAINMVKRTAGSLALVTSKEPLRAGMTNLLRQLTAELPQGIPEGTIIMCVNSNIDMACSQVEKKAEERAVPEIEEMIEPELENRRRHRAARPNEPYVDSGLSRWALTIPNPYKLMPGTPGGLNPEQMAIYEEFAREPRVAPLGLSSTHGPSSSDATRSMANDILQDQYPGPPMLPPSGENTVMPHLTAPHQPYVQPPAPITNGRIPVPVDPRVLMEKITELLEDLVQVAANAPERHYMELPRPHPVIDIVDALISLIIRNSQVSFDASTYCAEQICQLLFSQPDRELAIESLVHVLETLCKFPGGTARRVVMLIAHEPDESLLNVPLALALIRTDIALLDWQRVDLAASKALQGHDLAALDFLSSIMDRVLLNDRPVALYTDFARSLEALDQWQREEPDEVGRQLIQKLKSSGLPPSLSHGSDEQFSARKDQMEYIFEEWLHLCNNANATDKTVSMFIHQLHNKQILNDSESSCLFFRLCIDISVNRYDYGLRNNGPPSDIYSSTDGLAKLIVHLLKHQGAHEHEIKSDKAAYLESVLSLIVLVLNQHHVMRGEAFNQKVFFRLFSTVLCELASGPEDFAEADRQRMFLKLGETFLTLNPSHFPGFIFGWLGLVSHRHFLSPFLRIPDQGGWDILIQIVEAFMRYLGELLKPLELSLITRDIYRGALKVLVVLFHDAPEFLAAYHTRLCAVIPVHCIQLHNLVLTANQSSFAKMPDPLQPGLKIDRIDEIRDSPTILFDVEGPLREAGLLDLINQALTKGPSEDAVAHIAHAIHRKKGYETSVGFVPVNVDTRLIDAIVLHVGMHAIEKATQKNGPSFIQASPDAALLNMLIHELSPEARYYFLNTVVNQLRFPNSHTHYFSQALLEVFGSDMNDQEESDIRQQITRIFFERLMGHWPQPWGLILTVVELVKNDKYMFFDLPFVKSVPEVGQIYRHIFENSTNWRPAGP